MKNIKDKKAEANINKLILSLAKNKITKLERNKAEFKIGA